MGTDSRVFAPDYWTIAAALAGMDKRLGKTHSWQGADDLQKSVLAYLAAIQPDIKMIRGLAGVADFDYDVINDAMDKAGFGRFMEPFANNGQNIGMAGAFKYNGLYRVPGKPAEVMREGVAYDAVKLSLNNHGVEIYDVTGLPMIVVPLQPGEKLIIMPCEGAMDPFQVHKLGIDLRTIYKGGQQKNAGGEYDNVVIPLVDIPDHLNDIDFMLGMTADAWSITKAKQKILFQMGVRGVKVEARTQLVASRTREDTTRDLVVDKPFVATIVNTLMAAGNPLFTGRPAIADWKNPDIDEDAVAA